MIKYKAFKEQAIFHRAREQYRIRGAFSGKRGGKTEAGAIESIIFTENQIGHNKNSIDPYVGVIIAPTNDMLRRLCFQKFLAYAKPWDYQYNKSLSEILWPNGSIIYGISGDRPQRLEGIKANFIWIDEMLQVDEQLFLEAKARVSDSQGHIWCTSSLGVQYNNPKNHWAFRYFKENPDQETFCIEWSTIDNPYFPKNEINRLKESLDPRTFRQMFEIDWDVPGTALVYDQFNNDNISSIQLSNHEIYCSIDWGYAHEMACLYFAYNRVKDTVYQIDEIVSSRMTIDSMYKKMMGKNYRVKDYICDIAGDQTREQTGLSNIQWFKNRGIFFKTRRTAVGYGIPIIRSYIRDGLGRVKFYIDPRCKRTIDQMKNYSYPQKDGTIINENPIKKDDDTLDALRYFFVNILDPNLKLTARVYHYA